MSEIKELIKRLDAFVKNESYWIVPTGCTLFKEIKSFLEQQPIPDEGILVEKIITAVMKKDNSRYQFDKQYNYDWLRAELRTLLQSRQPNVTREEIEHAISGLFWDMPQIAHRIKIGAEAMACFLKSKGIPVKGEK